MSYQLRFQKSQKMFETLAAALLTGLSLWEHKEKTKLADKVIELKRLRYEEQNKSEDLRSDAVLDNLEFELRLAAHAFYSLVREQNSSDI